MSGTRRKEAPPTRFYTALPATVLKITGKKAHLAFYADYKSCNHNLRPVTEPMRMPNTPTVALASDHIETYAVETGCPEMELWRAVLRLAADDLFSSNERIRQDAIGFFQGADLLQVMAYAAIDHDLAPWLRRRALELAEASLEQRQPTGKRISY